MHGLHLNEAKEIVRDRLKEIKEDFKEGRIKSQRNDDRNHIVKIVCGRGTHS